LALGVSECQQWRGYVPTYQYACTACGHQLEAVQSFSEDPLTECPACAGRLRKLFSSVGIVFKGSGFYRTDSRGTTGEAKESSKTETKSDSKTESTKSESKPATESKAKPAAAPAA
jgi:putative FmdB family regulatory protein